MLTFKVVEYEKNVFLRLLPPNPYSVRFSIMGSAYLDCWHLKQSCS